MLILHKEHLFRLEKDFDACFFNGVFVVKSKNYRFRCASAMNSETLLRLLKSQNYHGRVVFDCLMSNGLRSSRRFMENHFKGGKFDITQLTVCNNEDAFKHNEYYRTSGINMKYSLLSSEDIKEISKKKRND